MIFTKNFKKKEIIKKKQIKQDKSIEIKALNTKNLKDLY